MKKGWEVKELGDFYEITSSKRVFKAEWKSSGIPFYRAREIVKLASQDFVENELFITEEMYNSYASKYGIPKPDDIMVTGVGTLGICYVVKPQDKFYFKDGNIIWLRRKSDINSRYIEYAFKSEFLRKQIDNSVGATVETYTIIKAKGTKIPVPSRDEQQRIVSILDEAFAAIDKAKVNIERNLQNAKELFQSELEAVFLQNGDGWIQRKIGDVCKMSRGHNPPKSKFISEPKDGYIRFYQIRDGWKDDYAVYVPDSPQLHKVETTDILMVAYRHIGKVFRGVSGAFNVALCKIVNIRKDILNDDFLFYMIPTQIIKGELMKRSERSLIPSMSLEHLKEINIPLPPLETQEKIVSQLNKLEIKTKQLENLYQNRLDNLEDLKKSILQKAFSGELKTKDIEAVVA